MLLKDIPSTGLDIWTDLKARSERSKVEGQLHLRLSLATREERDLPEDERQFETKQHCDLITIFIDYELRKSKVSIYSFLSNLADIQNFVKWAKLYPSFHPFFSPPSLLPSHSVISSFCFFSVDIFHISAKSVIRLMQFYAVPGGIIILVTSCK